MTTLTISFIVIGIIILLSLFSNKTNPAFENINSIVSIFNKGYSLTGGLRATTREVANKNALIIGGSGSGKTSTVLLGTLNSISRGNSSMVILDVSGEIFTLFSGYLSKKFKIYCIDFSVLSDGWNPLDSCTSVTDIQKVAASLIKNSGTTSKSDPYWSASAENLLNIFMQYLIGYTEPEYRTMANLVRMVETFAGEPQKIDKCFARVNENLLTSYKALISAGDKTLASTISSAFVAIKLFKTPDIARCTSKSTFNFENFRKEKSILFINTPISEVNFLAPLSALIFEQLFKVVLSRIPKKNECFIYAILDEMVCMRFENLGLVYSQIRKFSGGCIGIIQDERMLELNYSVAESHSIRTNSFSKVYLQNQPHATCKILEEMIGKDENNKSVMTASEIRTSDKAIILCGNKKPFKEKMIPYYEHIVLSARTRYPKYELDKKLDFDQLPLLEFK